MGWRSETGKMLANFRVVTRYVGSGVRWVESGIRSPESGIKAMGLGIRAQLFEGQLALTHGVKF